MSNTSYCPKFDGDKVCGGPVLWGAMEKYQSTTKDWTPARQLIFFDIKPTTTITSFFTVLWCQP
jgi:hypothetical protein